MEKKTLTLREIFATQNALQDLEAREWDLRAGRRISVLSEQLVKYLKEVEETRQKIFEKYKVKDYSKLSPEKQEEIDKVFNDFLDNEEAEITFVPMTEKLLGTARLKGSTYRQLAFFFEYEEDKPEPVKPEDVTE